MYISLSIHICLYIHIVLVDTNEPALFLKYCNVIVALSKNVPICECNVIK